MALRRKTRDAVHTFSCCSQPEWAVGKAALRVVPRTAHMCRLDPPQAEARAGELEQALQEAHRQLAAAGTEAEGTAARMEQLESQRRAEDDRGARAVADALQQERARAGHETEAARQHLEAVEAEAAAARSEAEGAQQQLERAAHAMPPLQRCHPKASHA